ncbi:hypothetical protein P7C73_g1995, partial [Tremellales sp. Uapishka_1]
MSKPTSHQPLLPSLAPSPPSTPSTHFSSGKLQVDLTLSNQPNRQLLTPPPTLQRNRIKSIDTSQERGQCFFPEAPKNRSRSRSPDTPERHGVPQVVVKATVPEQQDYVALFEQYVDPSMDEEGESEIDLADDAGRTSDGETDFEITGHICHTPPPPRRPTPLPSRRQEKRRRGENEGRGTSPPERRPKWEHHALDGSPRKPPRWDRRFCLSSECL